MLHNLHAKSLEKITETQLKLSGLESDIRTWNLSKIFSLLLVLTLLFLLSNYKLDMASIK